MHAYSAFIYFLFFRWFAVNKIASNINSPRWEQIKNSSECYICSKCLFDNNRNENDRNDSLLKYDILELSFVFHPSLRFLSIQILTSVDIVFIAMFTLCLISFLSNEMIHPSWIVAQWRATNTWEIIVTQVQNNIKLGFAHWLNRWFYLLSIHSFAIESELNENKVEKTHTFTSSEERKN